MAAAGRPAMRQLVKLAIALVLGLLPASTVAEVSLDDMVIAFPIDEPHMPLAIASRAWRKGVRTIIAANFNPSDEVRADAAAHNEVWTSYPDDNPLRSLYGGDSRAALMPFLAYKHYGDTFKWLLYGDDDTIFFLDSVQRLLADFDHNIPYFITDHFWWASTPNHPFHPNKEAPRCLPCHHQLPPGADASKAPLDAPIGCPCTPALLCAKDPGRRIYNEWCDIPRAPALTYSMHGGAGALVSVGMLRNISWEWIETCTKKQYSTGGDAFISICLWKAGFAMTDPGIGFYQPEITMFDPGPEDRMGVMMKLSHALNAHCDDTCWTQLDHMMTLHVRSRMFPSLHDAGFFIQAVSGMFDSFAGLRRSRELTKAAEAGTGAGAAAEPPPAAAGGDPQAGP